MFSLKRLIGNKAEDKATTYLKKQGYKIIERNYNLPCGEIDIIAQKDKTLVFEKEAKKMDRFIQFAVVAADEAVKDAGLDNIADSDIDPYRVGVIVSSAAGGFRTFEDNHIRIIEKGPNKCSPFTIPMLIVNIAAGKVSNFPDHYYPSGYDLGSILSECALNATNGMDASENIKATLENCDIQYDAVNVN